MHKFHHKLPEILWVIPVALLSYLFGEWAWKHWGPGTTKRVPMNASRSYRDCADDNERVALYFGPYDSDLTSGDFTVVSNRVYSSGEGWSTWSGGGCDL